MAKAQGFVSCGEPETLYLSVFPVKDVQKLKLRIWGNIYEISFRYTYIARTPHMWISSSFYIASQPQKSPANPISPPPGVSGSTDRHGRQPDMSVVFSSNCFSPFWAKLKQRVSSTQCILMAGEEWDEVTLPDLPKISKNGKPRMLTLCTSSCISRIDPFFKAIFPNAFQVNRMLRRKPITHSSSSLTTPCTRLSKGISINQDSW